MDVLARIGEARIREAIAAGALDGLPGAGRPLPDDGCEGLPDDLRCAYRILKGAGWIPPELEQHAELLRLRDLLACCGDDEESRRAIARMAALEAELGIARDRARVSGR